MARFNKIRIGDCLVQKGLITEEQLQQALEAQKQKGSKIGETLVDLGFITEDDLIDVLTEQLRIEYVDLRKYKVPEEVTELLKESFMRENSLLPIGYDPLVPNVLRVAMADPTDIIAIDDISIITNLQVDPVLSTKAHINIAIDKIFGSTQAMQAINKEYEEIKRAYDI